MRACWPLAPLAALVLAIAPVQATSQEGGRRWHALDVEPGSMWLVKVKANGTPLTLLVDTGASQNVISKRAAVTAGITGTFQMPAMGVGAEMVTIASIDTLRVGSWSGTRQVCALMDLSGAAAAIGGLDGILGMPWLMKFKYVDFDFKHRTLRVAEYLPDETPPANMLEQALQGRSFTRPAPPAEEPGGSGATLAETPGGLRVIEVEAGSRAAQGGLRAGDLIEEIDEEAAEHAGQLDARLKAIGSGKVTVAGRRDGAAFRARIPARRATKQRGR